MRAKLETNFYKDLATVDIFLLNSCRIFSDSSSEVQKETLREDAYRTLQVYESIITELQTNNLIVTDFSQLKNVLESTVDYLKRTPVITMDELQEKLFTCKIKQNFNVNLSAYDESLIKDNGLGAVHKFYSSLTLDQENEKDKKFIDLMNSLFSSLAYYIKVEQVDLELFKEIDNAMKSDTMEINTEILESCHIAYRQLLEQYGQNARLNLLDTENSFTLGQLEQILNIESNYDINESIITTSPHNMFRFDPFADYYNNKYIIYDSRAKLKHQIMEDLTRNEQIEYDEEPEYSENIR